MQIEKFARIVQKNHDVCASFFRQTVNVFEWRTLKRVKERIW